jgi:hypothetical protein
VSCPFGLWGQFSIWNGSALGLEAVGTQAERSNETDKLAILQQLSFLTSRERGYIMGIPWERKIMYHRLTSRMLEISVQLAVQFPEEISFYFLQSREAIVKIESLF